MALRTRHITCELYLEGINVPFSSVSIAEKMGTPPSCNISFPVTSKALKILAGTTVHVFGTTEMKVDGGDIEVQEILLFEGEVSGFGYSKTAQGKSLSVTAESLMHKWATVYKQSSDIVTNSTFTNALLVITSTQSLIDSLDKIVKDSKEKDLESLNSKTLKDALAKMYDFDYSSTDGFGGFFSFFQTAWKSDEKAKERGDWYPLFVGFIKHIEILNYYYSMVAKSFKLSDTIFCFPNKELKDTLELLVGNAIVGGQSGHMGNSTTLLAMLAKMLDFVHYRSIFPASPTYTYHPTAPNNLRVPMRTYFLPDLKWGPPILSNVIFPNETISVSFKRNLSGEKTRAIAGSPPFNIGSGKFTPDLISASYIAPGLELLKAKSPPKDIKDTKNTDEDSKSTDPYVLSFTKEETYRGVNKLDTQLEGFESAYIANLVKGENNEKKISAVFGESSASKLALNATNMALLESRYMNRQCSITASWNPFRMVGFPALVFDTDESPPILGVLSSHTVNITADGSATSSITLGGAHVVWDLENIDSMKEMEAEVDLNEESAGVHRFSSIEADPLPYLPEWLDPNWYSSKHIGRDVYTVVQEGKIGRSTPTPGDTAWKEGHSSMEPYVKNFIKKGLRSNSLDSSIFSLIRNPRTGVFLTGGDESAFDTQLDEQESVKMAKRISRSIRVLKNGYAQAVDNNWEDKYILNMTSRNIITKKDYWKFLLHNNGEEPNKDRDYKETHGGAVKHVSPLTLQKLAYDYLSKEGDNPLYTAHEYIENIDDEVFKHLLRPFTKKRADHVRELNNFTRKDEVSV